MPVMICMLRGVNVGGHNKISMETLRGICASLKFQDARTYVQSGNVVFRTDQRSEARVAASLENAIESKLGFRPAVVLRKAADFRAVIAANPFRARKDIHHGKLLVSFLSARPTADAWDELRKIKADPEELRIADRELYIYFPDGMGRSKFPWAKLDKILGTPATGRNWNTVLKRSKRAKKREKSA